MNRESAKLPTSSHLEFLKESDWIIGRKPLETKWLKREGRPSWIDVEDCLNGKLHLIQAHNGEGNKGLCSFLQRKWKAAEEKYFIVTRVQGSQESTPTSVLPYILHSEEVPFGMYLTNILYLIISHISSRKLYYFYFMRRTIRHWYMNV
jgi:hypothetical protein